ncbi:MAG: hypothetical protein PHX44_01720 [Sulfurimonas sp.]|uniref:hypothetical protein n=1 Tax=Sulfurimonas sp. TaxID=2022749 RepID=UPI002622B4AC|nr:hypothetical protein [Sulfurimonas sp.]MDD2651736.1 hypothetical protein [Sulfurimonas sp.]MDD2651753.1 hypothetical protein [Sulfurimonas sp.]MDD3451695.1 hypothetical protein [Sulfurimonas sp.]MDD3451712.1 hypothetical protein [Sulfurimonas sp.]
MAQAEQVKDLGSKPLTIADVQEQTRIYLERLNTNKILIAGKIKEKRVSEPRLKIDKKTGEVILDEDGKPQYWNPYYTVVIAFEGGEMSINVKSDWHEMFDVGMRVLFEGSFGLSFGNISPVFHKYTIL